MNQRLIALNGQSFANLHELEFISLQNNYCIDRSFHDNAIKTTALISISNSCGFEELVSVEIVCERFIIPELYNFEFCDMTGKTVINATNFVIADLRDEEIEGIDFTKNKKIEYLPYKIYMHLPNLVYYWASICALKQISKENFEKLNRLQAIDLSHNQIKKIHGNTFNGLDSLIEIDLRKFFIYD